MNYVNPFNKSVTGLEIKDWIRYNTTIKTMYTSLARTMNKFYNLDDKKVYMLKLCDGIPVAVPVEKRGVKYEVPCDN